MKTLLIFGFVQLPPVSKNVLHLGFVQTAKFSGSLLNLGFVQQKKISGSLLNLGFEISPLPKHRFHFRGSQTQRFGDFDVQLLISGNTINLCDLVETMSIQRGENESALCEFVLLPPRERGNPQPIDLFSWYQKPVQVHVVSARENLCIFKGYIDSVDFKMLRGRVYIRCSDRREDGLMGLSRDFVKNIGFTSKSAHGDVFESVKDEVEARLQTVPASLERNLNGNMVITPWAGGRSSHVISPCSIYQREPELNLIEIGGVLGSVEITLNLRYVRLFERHITLNLNSGLSICDYGRYQGLPKLEEAVSAIAQTGWALGSFQAERVEPNGWYSCGGGRFAWLRDGATIEQTKSDESGKESQNARDITLLSRRLNTLIKSGSFNVSKRWQQQIIETYRVVLSSGAPSTRKQGISFDVSLKLPDGLKWEAKSVHEKGVKFTHNRYSFAHVQANVVSFPKSFVWQRSKFGDIYADLIDESHEFRATEQVAVETAKTMMLATHRNRIKFEMKFLPDASVQQRHRIKHSHFEGTCKVFALRHHFDFSKKIASSELTYSFFKKLGSGGAKYRKIEREPLPTSPFTSGFNFGRTMVSEKTEIDDAQHLGVIYREIGRNRFYLEKITVRTPEIEASSTENREIARDFDYGIDVPDGEVEIFI